MKMNFCVGHGAEPDMSLVSNVARTAEDNAFTYMTLLDAPGKTLDVHLMMWEAVRSTKNLMVGQGVANLMTYNPITLANACASIDRGFPGRVFVGLGTGYSMGKGRPPAKHRDMREAVAFIRDYTSGEEAEYRGGKMQSRWIRNTFPIYISAHGPKTLQLAGEIADGVIFLCSNPVYVKWQLDQIAVGAERAGRDPSTIDTWLRCMVYVTPDKKLAKRETSAYPSSYAGLGRVLVRDLPEVEDLKRRLEKHEPGIVDELIKDTRRYSEALDPKIGERLDSPHSKVVTDRMIDFFHFRGSEDEICEHINKLAGLGVKAISMTTYTLVDKIGMLKEVGSKVVPHFSRAAIPAAFTRKSESDNN